MTFPIPNRSNTMTMISMRMDGKHPDLHIAAHNAVNILMHALVGMPPPAGHTHATFHMTVATSFAARVMQMTAEVNEQCRPQDLTKLASDICAAIMDHAEDVADILPERQTEFRKSMEK